MYAIRSYYAIKNVDGVKLYAISSRTLSSARKFAEEFNCILWYEGTEDFYINKEIDLVYIATPNSSHYQYTIDCINVITSYSIHYTKLYDVQVKIIKIKKTDTLFIIFIKPLN